MPHPDKPRLRVWAGERVSVRFDDRSERLAVNPIVRAALDDRFDPDSRRERYGSLASCYELTGPRDAEVALLPRVLEQTEPADLHSLLSRAERHGLRTVVFASHDLEPVMPSASVILLHPGPTRGAQPHADVLALPYLFTDRYGALGARPGGERPSVAFCGQGATRRGAGTGQVLARAARVAANRFRPRVVPPPVRGHVGLRATAIDRLTDDPRVDDRFIIRDRYRAGVSSDADRARTQAEFDDNLRSAMYALCVRGTGNFSARFYEALSFGRVPLFVNTDCVLPFEDEIDWKARTIWVESTDVASIGEHLVASHAQVAEDPARSVEALRELWKDWLTTDGYFARLPPLLRRRAAAEARS